MTAWESAALALVVSLAVAAVGVLRGTTLDRLTALQLVGVLAPLFAVVVAVATGRGRYLEVGVVLAILTLAGALAYGRFLERWL